MKRIALFLKTACVLAAAAGGTGAHAQQTWPTQRVTFVSPLAPGGGIDAVARLISPQLSQKWGQPVIIENRPGAGLTLAANYVAKSAPDGHTMMVAGWSFAAAPLFMKVDLVESDLKQAIQLVRGAWLAITNADVPAKTLAEFITYAKANPKALNVGVIPNASSELEMLDFTRKAGIQMTNIPYNSMTQSTTSVLRNELQFLFVPAVSIVGMMNTGRLTVLAATSAQRMEQYPNVPTIREFGVDYDGGFDIGLHVPARTPDAIIARIGADAAAAVKSPELAPKFRDQGFEASGVLGPAWAEEKDRKLRVYKELTARYGIKPQ